MIQKQDGRKRWFYITTSAIPSGSAYSDGGLVEEIASVDFLENRRVLENKNNIQKIYSNYNSFFNSLLCFPK